MPQLDFSTYVPQVFWLAFLFLVLYVVMQFWAMPRVGGVLEARRHHIDGDLTTASRLKNEAEATLAAYEKTLATARAEAQALLRTTGEQLAAEAAERQRQLGATLAEQIAAAEQRIAAAKATALSEVRGVAVEVAGAVVEKLVGRPADTGGLRGAVEHAIAAHAAQNGTGGRAA